MHKQKSAKVNTLVDENIAGLISVISDFEGVYTPPGKLILGTAP
jgi:hypothetical protein